MFYSFRLKLLDVVAKAEAELLKVEAEKEVKFIWCGAGCWKMAILGGKISGVEAIDRKSVEGTPEPGGGSGGIVGGAGSDIDVDARADDGAWVDGTVGSSAAILSVTGTGGTGAVAPAMPGKMVSKLKLIYDDPPGWAET